MEKKEQPKGIETTKKSRNPLLYVIFGVIVILLAVKVFLDYREKQELQEFYQTEMAIAREKLDDLNEELTSKIQQIDSLGGDIDDLIKVQEELTAERDQLQRTRTANRQLIGRLRRKTDGYEELLKEKDKEIIKLKEVNELLVNENSGLKEEANELNRNIVSLSQDKEQLQEKVAYASRLKAENIAVYAVSRSGRERDGVLRNRQLKQLKVSFNIGMNDVAPLSAKEIMVRIIDENDQVIFDVEKGSGSFILDGKSGFEVLPFRSNHCPQRTWGYHRSGRCGPDKSQRAMEI
jgi:cell division protein ZapB